MSSLVPGYQYDIFISYRQKDNKNDGWVTEFVNNLKGELESTFKEDVSVYFDLNPHDGLLETHDVDASIKDKLKCLIFIPIISRTYCDPKSYAWQNEFCVFNKLVKEDQFGRDIRLTGGNVASRILPVKINELDPEDKTLLENELGGVLRSVDFIFKSAGVNRPLRANEDHQHDNLNKTYYRDQINKVANAVKEVITAIKKYDQQDEIVSEKVKEARPLSPKNFKAKIILGSLVVITLIALVYFFIPKLFKSSEQVEKSIAVLPFKSLSSDPEKQYLADGVMDAILLHLQKFKDLRVISRTSVEQYRGTTKTTHIIGEELDVNYLLEGSFQKFGDEVRLIVQLIKTSEESHSWAKEYDRNWNDIFSVQSEVAQTIARELYIIITPGEKQLIEKISTPDMTAYDLYLKANNYLNEYVETRNLSFYQKASTFYKAALEIDSAFAKAYTGLARTYFTRYFWETYFKENYLDSCLTLVNLALNFDDQLDEAYFLKGRYYRFNGHIEEALDNFDKALEINPNYSQAYNNKGYLLTEVKKDFVSGIDNYQKALTIIRGDERKSLLQNLGWAYLDCGFIDKDKYYTKEKLALDKDSASYFFELAWIEFCLENFEECLRFSKKANDFDSTLLIPQEFFICLPPAYKEEAYLNAKERIERFKKSGRLLLVGSHRVGYFFWQMGKTKEAEYYFGQQIKIGEESIKLGRDIAQKKFAQYDLAATYAFLGDKEKAYRYLDEFNTLTFIQLWWVSLLKNDPLFNSIRNEERFKKIILNVESKWQAEHKRVQKWLEEQEKL